MRALQFLIFLPWLCSAQRIHETFGRKDHIEREFDKVINTAIESTYVYRYRKGYKWFYKLSRIYEFGGMKHSLEGYRMYKYKYLK